MTGNRWLQKLEESPGHSTWYIERFRTMAAEGKDLHGEARFVDAMVGREATILDAGCGPGRVGGRLAELGHYVVGVDLDPALIAAAEQDHPGPTWLVGDLSTLELAALGLPAAYDVIVAPGNVMVFLDPATRRTVLDRLRRHLAEAGRIVVGFATDREYPRDAFFADVAAVGLQVDLRLSTWDLRPLTDDADFIVAVLSPAGTDPAADSASGMTTAAASLRSAR